MFLARWLLIRCGAREYCADLSGGAAAKLLFEFTQTYLMQWTGQKIMFDLRREIFGHLQRMHVGFYDESGGPAGNTADLGCGRDR